MVLNNQNAVLSCCVWPSWAVYQPFSSRPKGHICFYRCCSSVHRPTWWQNCHVYMHISYKGYRMFPFSGTCSALLELPHCWYLVHDLSVSVVLLGTSLLKLFFSNPSSLQTQLCFQAVPPLLHIGYILSCDIPCCWCLLKVCTPCNRLLPVRLLCIVRARVLWLPEQTRVTLPLLRLHLDTMKQVRVQAWIFYDMSYIHNCHLQYLSTMLVIETLASRSALAIFKVYFPVTNLTSWLTQQWWSVILCTHTKRLEVTSKVSTLICSGLSSLVPHSDHHFHVFITYQFEIWHPLIPWYTHAYYDTYMQFHCF